MCVATLLLVGVLNAFERVFNIVVALLDNHNDLISNRIILLKDGRKVLLQLLGIVVRSDDDGHRLQIDIVRLLLFSFPSEKRTEKGVVKANKRAAMPKIIATLSDNISTMFFNPML